jgi:hypothetical protein
MWPVAGIIAATKVVDLFAYGKKEYSDSNGYTSKIFSSSSALLCMFYSRYIKYAYYVGAVYQYKHP